MAKTLKEWSPQDGDIYRVVEELAGGDILTCYIQVVGGVAKILPDVKAAFSLTLTPAKVELVMREGEHPMWKNMTNAQKGDILLSIHEGRGFEMFLNGGWRDAGSPAIKSVTPETYCRVKPQVETVTLYSGNMKQWHEDQYPSSRFEMTYRFVDGRTDTDSFKVRRL